MTLAFISLLAIWLAASLLRVCSMYDRSSIFQRWRRWDWFHLVPIGAFFGPGVPQTEAWIVMRDFLPDGSVTAWTETPRIRRRHWLHALWNPQKQVYRARSDAAFTFLSTAAAMSVDDTSIPPAFLFSEPYIAILRYVTRLPRLTEPASTQFAVVETDISTGEVVCSVVSSVHHV